MLPASLLKLLLIRSGIEQNPGPIFQCAKCKIRLNGRSYELQCNACHNWLHLRCSLLKSHRDWLPNWAGPCCTSPTIAPLRQPLTNRSSRTRPTTPSTLPPAPPSRTTTTNKNSKKSFNILQYIIKGLHGKHEELMHYLEKKRNRCSSHPREKIHIQIQTKRHPKLLSRKKGQR